MVQVEMLDTMNRRQVNEFIQLPFRIYANTPQWVPPFYSDVRIMLDRNKHPFYEHSEADFFLARRNGQVVGRIAALHNKPFNRYHETKQAVFYLFECEDDQEVANALFERAFEWARQRGLNKIVGPKGFSPFDGYGIQIEGFEHRQMMTMMNYNLPYYVRLVETLGFEKEVDFVSCYLPASKLNLPEKAREIARRVSERGTFRVQNFENKAQLKAWAPKIGEAYNKTFVNNWEYYPLSEREVKYVVDMLITVADPHLIKIILYNEEVVGFLFAFHDVSAALQRARGRLMPWNLVDILLELKRTKWVSGNGVGVLPEYQGRGGTALMYAELEKTVKQYGFEHLEMTQVAETAVQMRRDLINLGGTAYKNHRVYHRSI
jgi:GNAT superfamily N-acetyltransferase